MILSNLFKRMPSFLIILILLNSCGSSGPAPSLPSDTSQAFPALDVNLLAEGTEITAAGQQLMDQPLGVFELRDGEQKNDSVLVVAVHGYESRGYEWVTGLKNLARYYGSVYFFRYDWEQCPDEIGELLVAKIKQLQEAGHYKRLVIFGHSYGGMVVTFAASQLGRIPTDIHVIAAPLSGFPGLLDACENLEYDGEDKLIYETWNQAVHLIQHRTVHSQDGAFRELDHDPQEIDLPFYESFTLPPTMDGHRLGHNWSVTWVLDKYVGKPHHL